jgi:uncharacterized protein YkwD
MEMLCKDFNSRAFSPTAVMLIHLHKFHISQASEDDPSSSIAGASFIAGSSFTVRTKRILERLQLLNHFAIFIQLSPLAELTPSLAQSIRKARKQNRKKHEARHLTSEENIENASDKMILEMGREGNQKERNGNSKASSRRLSKRDNSVLNYKKAKRLMTMMIMMMTTTIMMMMMMVII